MQKIEKISAAAFPVAVRDGVVLVDFLPSGTGRVTSRMTCLMRWQMKTAFRHR